MKIGKLVLDTRLLRHTYMIPIACFTADLQPCAQKEIDGFGGTEYCKPHARYVAIDWLDLRIGNQKYTGYCINFQDFRF